MKDWENKYPKEEISDNWNLMLGMIYLLFLIGVVSFLYIACQKPIHRFLNKPSYSKEYLAEYTKKRVRMMPAEPDLVENGIHLGTGMKMDEHFFLVKSACLTCHSSKLITQNRATAEGWTSMIRWMQKTQGLPDLGDKEKYIVKYLAKNYAPEEASRRPNLNIEAIEWYILEEETNGE